MGMIDALFTPGGAACVVLGHALLTKFAMTLLWRARFTVGGLIPRAEIEKLEESVAYKRWHATQLNEAEWASLLFPAYLFLHVTGVSAPLTCAMGAAGQITYFWPRALIGNQREGGPAIPPYLPGAMARYTAVAFLIPIIWSAVSN